MQPQDQKERVASNSGNERASQELIEMLTAGVLDLGQVVKLTRNYDEVEALLKVKYAALAGNPIGAADAHRKYGIRKATIFEWIKSGDLTPLSSGQVGGGYVQTQLDEQKVAILAELIQLRLGKSGPVKPRGRKKIR